MDLVFTVPVNYISPYWPSCLLSRRKSSKYHRGIHYHITYPFNIPLEPPYRQPYFDMNYSNKSTWIASTHALKGNHTSHTYFQHIIIFIQHIMHISTYIQLPHRKYASTHTYCHSSIIYTHLYEHQPCKELLQDNV